MTSKREIDVYDREGIFVVIVDGKSQSPIVLEAEAYQCTRDKAERRIKDVSWATRACVCRLVPVSGNELLALDMIRLQPKDEDPLF